jgi:Ca2+-binding EF-hand superfamily protein
MRRIWLGTLVCSLGLVGMALADDQKGSGSDDSSATPPEPRRPDPGSDLPEDGAGAGQKEQASNLDFVTVDSNRDGTISQSELDRVKGNEFSKLDRNRDGRVDRAEFGKMSPLSRQDLLKGSGPPAAMSSAFADADANGDGRLSRGEASSILKERTFSSADRNADGYLDRTEFPSPSPTSSNPGPPQVEP